MKIQDPIHKAVSFYASLLQMYPKMYRQTFEAQILQTFKDHYKDIYDTKGSVGINFWLGVITDECLGIIREQFNSFKGGVTMKTTLKQPSAWLPIALSVTVLALFLISFAMFGIPHRSKDEGTAAHLFQIWGVIEVLMVAFFAIKWLPQKPKQTLVVLTLQIAAVLAACSPVFLFNL